MNVITLEYYNGASVPPRQENLKSPYLFRHSCQGARSRSLCVFQFFHSLHSFQPCCLDYIQGVSKGGSGSGVHGGVPGCLPSVSLH